MKLTSKEKPLLIRSISEDDLSVLFNISYGKNADLQWRATNGPYFNDPILDKENFYKQYYQYAISSDHRGVIVYDDEIVGEMFAYWMDKELQQWCEFGILIYSKNNVNKGIGTTACHLWMDYLFTLYSHIQRVGFTTWSKNHAMIRVGEKCSMKQEACIRKVRFYQGEYYDSIKYGILRDEFYNSK